MRRFAIVACALSILSIARCVRAEDTSRVLFFGSSTTYGIGASKPARRWSTLLCRYLGWTEVNRGVPGSTLAVNPSSSVPSGVDTWKSAVADPRPARLFFMYGANDARLTLPLGTPGVADRRSFSGALDETISGLVAGVGADSLVMITPQPSLAILAKRAPYDRALLEAAARGHVLAIDAGVAFPRELISLYSADGMHLNDLGHAAFASFLAAHLTDAGWAPSAPIVESDRSSTSASAALPAGRLRADGRAITAGEVRAIEARWLSPGRAVLGVVRPDGAGGYRAIYRSVPVTVTATATTTPVPRWRVLDGDRLAAWSEGASLGGVAGGSHVSLAAGEPTPIRDMPAAATSTAALGLALRAVRR